MVNEVAHYHELHPEEDGRVLIVHRDRGRGPTLDLPPHADVRARTRPVLNEDAQAVLAVRGLQHLGVDAAGLAVARTRLRVGHEPLPPDEPALGAVLTVPKAGHPRPLLETSARGHEAARMTPEADLPLPQEDGTSPQLVLLNVDDLLESLAPGRTAETALRSAVGHETSPGSAAGQPHMIRDPLHLPETVGGEVHTRDRRARPSAERTGGS